MNGFKVVIILSVFVASCLSAVDETLVAKASGASVVEAALSKIESSCIFENDNLFLRRIAFVESSDGTDPNTYRAGYYGGIWQVDQQMFEQTQTSFLVSDKRQAILNYYGFNWNSVQWSDLLKPFYSGLAARLFNQLKTNSYSKFSSVSEQANFWKTNYRLNGDISTFVSKTNSLQNKCVRGAADVMFIVDESGSIGIDNYNKVKEFLKKVVNALNVGPDPVKDSRISILSFSNVNNLVFDFKTYSTKTDYINAISNMDYFGGGTNTYLALKYLREKAFDSSYGARSNLPKIAIVVTDGQSNDVSATIVEARKLQKSDITVLAVGVGSGVYVQELDEIATDPDCKHRFLLDDFQAFDSFLSVIEKKTCDAPVIVQNKTIINIPTSGSQPCKVSVTSNGITIEIYNSGGNSTIYFSNVTSPSSSFYDYKFYFGSDVVTIYLPYSSSNDGSNSYAYCRVEGEPNTNVTVNPCSGNCDRCSQKPCPAGKICKSDVYFTYKCVDPDLPLLSGYNCDTNNPCTTENALKNQFYFPSTVDGYFVQCSQWGQCFVMPCPRGLVWNVKAYTCTPPNWNGIPGNTGVTDASGSTGNNNSDPKDPTKYGYDCNTNNPCTPANAALKKFYFPAKLLGSFIQCSEWGQCYTMPCPPGQVWNVDKYTCTPIPSGPSSGNDGTCRNPNPNPNSGEYPGDGYDCGKRNPCTADNRAKNLYYFSHSDPNKFVQCGQWGSCDIMPCPPGLVWNVKAYTCTPTNWDPNNPSTTPTNPSPGYDCGVGNPCTPENRAKEQFFFPGKVQNKYVQCDVSGRCYDMTCPAGLVWSTKSNACDYPQSTPESTPAPAPVSCFYNCANNNPCTKANRDKKLYYFPNVNPSLFVQCDDFGGCFEMPCPPGQSWNVQEYTCTPTISNSNSNGGSGGIGSCPTIPSGTYDCSTKNPCTPENVALNLFYFPYSDSSKFVQCSAYGSCYIMPCPTGLTWNVRAYTCT